MIRLSKKAWNNVLIFSVMFMILLFNSTNDILNSGDQDEPLLPLVDGSQVIMTIEAGSTRVERIGQGWRLVPSGAAVEEELALLASSWHMARLQATDEQTAGQPLVVVLWLAGQQQGKVYQFYPQSTDMALVKIDNQLYRLQDRTLADLLPPGVL